MDIFEDNTFFRQLGLTKELSFLLNTDGQTFRDRFNGSVSDDLNFFGVSGHKKNFHGQIRSRSFDISRPTKSINNTSIAMTKGTYEDIDSKIKVSMVTYIPVTVILLMYSMLLFMVIIFNTLAINSGKTPALIFLTFNAFFIFFGLRTYFHLRKSVTTLITDVEREMGFWMASVNAMQQKL